MIVRPSAHRPGLTLLETMVALAIFTIGLTALSQLITIGSRNALEASLHADAMRLAQSKLAEVEAGAVAPDSSTSGTYDTETGWQWQMDSSQTSVPYVYLITVTVSRSPGSYPHSVTMTQMVYDSRQMGKSGEIANPTTTTTTGTATTTGTTTGGTTP
ncbi:type IV pilus modification PilV family protein [Limnoglobus roseus]|uniref:Prepilin-type cleavage/methylation domain-containing protein n=1 Tax=Limnoglobus roseus TaxID=2598579 RepID=A0A5C1AHA2_9BACT|nr:prepilin-type N-terminal cleavage/methylation domain-containing protein [Limnoglobus roseus]QEL18799.1 hypothetical protein PX52LOC_05839 [Limnoglobus roseus]